MGIYGRLSAYGDETTIEQQLEKAGALVDANGGYVALTFTDHGEPAFDRDNPDDRPAYGAMVDALHNGEIQAIAAYASDRLWRNDIERGLYARDAIRDERPLVFTPQKTYDFSIPEDDLMSTIVTAFSKYESAVKSRRIRDQKAKRRAAGVATSPVIAFGWYGTRHGAERNDGLTHYEPEAALIRSAAKRVLAGTSYTEIAREWQANPIALKPLGSEAEWTPAQVAEILTRPRTAGHQVHRGEIIARDIWPPILEPEVWEKLVAKKERGRYGKQSPRSSLWTGFIRCGREDEAGAPCAATMRFSKPNGRHKSGTFSCYTCNNTVVAGRVAAYAYEWIIGAADGTELERLVSAETGSDDALLAELAANHAELDEWLEMLKAREVSRTQYVELRDGTKARIAKLTRELAHLGARDAFAPYLGRGEILRELLAEDVLTPAEHRAVFLATGYHLWVDVASRRGSAFDPSRLRITRDGA
jgi:DNA invertase Pin-like site-specific DNA recombinase